MLEANYKAHEVTWEPTVDCCYKQTNYKGRNWAGIPNHSDHRSTYFTLRENSVSYAISVSSVLCTNGSFWLTYCPVALRYVTFILSRSYIQNMSPYVTDLQNEAYNKGTGAWWRKWEFWPKKIKIILKRCPAHVYMKNKETFKYVFDLLSCLNRMLLY